MVDRKLLICIPSPRDDPRFEHCMSFIPHDKLWMKYIPYIHGPYQKMRQYFLNNEEYTHLAICADDMLVGVTGVAKLWEDAKEYKVISGMTNYTIQDLEQGNNCRLAITKNLPALKREYRTTDFYTFGELAYTGIVPVKWQGTIFTIIPRHIIEWLSFDGDIWKGVNLGTGYAYDVAIAHQLWEKGQTQWVDTSVMFKHLKGEKLQSGLGKKPEQIWIDRVGRSREVRIL